MPPSPPAELGVTKKTGKPKLELKAWIEVVKLKGEKPIPEDDPIFDYAADIGLPAQYLTLAWRVFKRQNSEPRPKTGRVSTYADWRAAFRNAVRNNWGNLWRDDGAGGFVLTTAGKQEQRLYESEVTAARNEREYAAC